MSKTLTEQRWKWGSLTDLEIKDKEPELKEGYFMWMPKGPWIERPPSLNADEVKRFRKVVDCFTLNLLTGCFIGRCDRAMACGNSKICGKLFDLLIKYERSLEAMKAESVTLRAITQARGVLAYALNDGQTLAYMAANDLEPSDIEDVAAEILEYLDKTVEEEKPAKVDDFKILEIAERYIYQPTDFEEYNRELREKGFKERTPPKVGRHV